MGSDETTITGETTFGWLPGGFFLEQRAQLNFRGLQIHALELIGYDPRLTPSRPPSSPTSRPIHCLTDGAFRATM